MSDFTLKDSAETPGEEPSAARGVHPVLVTTAEWTWRLLVVFAGLLALGFLIEKFAAVVIPMAVALLGAALLSPFVGWMQRQGVPRAAAVVVAVLGTVGLLAGIMTFVVEQFIIGVPDLSSEFKHSIDEIRVWMTDGPFHFSQEQITQASNSVVKAIESNQDKLTSGALATATALGEFLTGALLALFTLIFFLSGGAQIWEFITRIVPTRNRPRVRRAGVAAFASLVGYVRATVLVALVDAAGIGAGLAILHVPLALPLSSLVFVGAFVPIIGAFATGFIAVFIALVTKGSVVALIVLAIIVAVMQLEGHVLQPVLMGRAVKIHPLAVVISIAAGMVLFGIAGALLAVPLVAMLNAAIRSLLGEPAAGLPDGVDLDKGESPGEAVTPAAPA